MRDNKDYEKYLIMPDDDDYNIFLYAIKNLSGEDTVIKNFEDIDCVEILRTSNLCKIVTINPITGPVSMKLKMVENQRYSLSLQMKRKDGSIAEVKKATLTKLGYDFLSKMVLEAEEKWRKGALDVFNKFEAPCL